VDYVQLPQQWVILNVVVNYRLKPNVKYFLAAFLKEDYGAWDIRYDVT
jgi:hypothetical protein